MKFSKICPTTSKLLAFTYFLLFVGLLCVAFGVHTIYDSSFKTKPESEKKMTYDAVWAGSVLLTLVMFLSLFITPYSIYNSCGDITLWALFLNILAL